METSSSGFHPASMNDSPELGNKIETHSLFIDNQEADKSNGLQSLVKYYQNLFDKEECENYSREHYQSAKRKYVKYMVNSRMIV